MPCYEMSPRKQFKEFTSAMIHWNSICSRWIILVEYLDKITYNARIFRTNKQIYLIKMELSIKCDYHINVHKWIWFIEFWILKISHIPFADHPNLKKGEKKVYTLFDATALENRLSVAAGSGHNDNSSDVRLSSCHSSKNWPQNDLHCGAVPPSTHQARSPAFNPVPRRFQTEFWVPSLTSVSLNASETVKRVCICIYSYTNYSDDMFACIRPFKCMR